MISAIALAYGMLHLFCGPFGEHHGKMRIIDCTTLVCPLESARTATWWNLNWLVVSPDPVWWLHGERHLTPCPRNNGSPLQYRQR